MNSLNPGIYDNLPMEQYHDDSAVGRSTLVTLLNRTPAHAKFGPKERTKAIDIGTAAHIAILEPDTFSHRVITGPNVRKNATVWKDFVEAHQDQIVLDQEDYTTCEAMRDSVYSNAAIAEYLRVPGKVEQSLFYDDMDTGIRCKIRPDRYAEDFSFLLDLKTTESADPRNFAKSIFTYSYHFQAAMYLHGVTTITKKPSLMPFIFIAVEKEPPYAAAMYELDQDSLDEGYNLYRQALERYKLCREFNDWPAYPSALQTIRIPEYGFKTITRGIG